MFVYEASCVIYSIIKGNEHSLPLEMCSHFDSDEIARLGKRFKKLDLDNSGSLSVDEFMRYSRSRVLFSKEKHQSA